MLLPDGFIDEFSRRFCDKEIIIYKTETEVEPDGGIIRRANIESSRFLGNVRFNNFGLEQTEIGLHLDIDITITCAKTVDIANGDTIEYLGKIYRVENILPSDSHLTITGKECQLKS